MREISTGLLYLSIQIIFCSTNAFAQSVNYEDGFEDGNFTGNPTWSGDTGDFTVVEGHPNFLLKLDASGTGPSYLSAPSAPVEGYWEFYIKFDGFEPSGSNQAELFLMSDIANLEGAVNGYAVQVGESGDDVFRIVRYDNGTEAATVLEGSAIVEPGGGYTLRVSRDTGGNWEMRVAEGYGRAFNSTITGFDDTYASASFFGPRVSFTSSRSDKFFFDFKINIPPFTIIDAATSGNSIDVTFNRPYDSASVQPGDFSVTKGAGSPLSVSLPLATVVRLRYDTTFISDEYTINAQSIQDQNGTAIEADAFTSFTVFGDFADGDVIISEFMYDPPSGQAEYVELKNRSDKFLNMQNWLIGDESNNGTLTTDTLSLRPDSYFVISSDTTNLFNIYGKRPYAQSVNLPAFNNGGDIVKVITADGSRVDSLRYTLAWGGNNAALERLSDAAPAFFHENFGDSPNPLGGTPGLPNKVAEDTTPPDLQNLVITDNRTLDMVFSERLKSGAAQNRNNYSLNNGIAINSVQQTKGDSLRLNLSSPLQNDTQYRFTVNNQQDIFGNTAGAADTSFTFFEVSPADSGDIFINEFTYDPPEGSAEYIELYNPSSKSVDLNGSTINDNTGNRRIITDNQFIIPPHSFVIIAPDQTLVKDYPDIALVTMGSRFPSFNNSGDDIVLRNKDGQFLDSLRYFSGWGGNEISLERRITSVAALQPNFGESPDGFGTPGSANLLLADEQPPSLQHMRVVDNTTIRLIFSETLTSKTATNKNNYTISPNHNIQLISSLQDTVTLFLSQELASDQSFTLTVNRLQDIFGNTLKQTSNELSFVKFSNAKPGNIVTNEFLYRRESAGSPEFVELFNRTDQNFDLSGWTLGDALSTAKLDVGTRIRAGDYLVLTDSKSLASRLDNAVFISGFPSLNDDEDAIYIQNAMGATIDSLFYSPGFGGIVNGKSAERRDPEAASNDPANFATGTADKGSTPGAPNSIFAPDETPPSLTFARIFPNGDIEVRFSEFISLTDDMQFSVNGQTLSVDSFNFNEGNRIFLDTPEEFEASGELTLSVKNLIDVTGNDTSETQIQVARLLKQGDVVINEILYDPINDSDDNRPDQSEYLELRNTRDYAVSLENISLHDAPDEGGETRGLIPVSTHSKYVPAHGTALIYADEALQFKKSRLAEFFELSNQSAHTLIRVNRSSLGLASEDDAIYLTGTEGIEIDSVFYDEGWHNPNLADAKGIALERINPQIPGNEPSNWGSSGDERGGTPNKENTLYQTSGEDSKGDMGIGFSPNPFSPDDDGFDDRLFINYKLDRSDYLITVHIYDRYGRQVRELADGKPAGSEGSLIWDGLKDNGNRNRIGIYIVIFKAFDNAGGRTKTYKKTVVLARRLN